MTLDHRHHRIGATLAHVKQEWGVHWSTLRDIEGNESASPPPTRSTT